MYFIYIGMTFGVLCWGIMKFFIPPIGNSIWLLLGLFIAMGILFGIIASGVYSCSYKVKLVKFEKIPIIPFDRNYYLYEYEKMLPMPKMIDRSHMSIIYDEYKMEIDNKPIIQKVIKFFRKGDIRFQKQNRIVRTKITHIIFKGTKGYIIKGEYNIRNPWVLEIFVPSPIYRIRVPENSLITTKEYQKSLYTSP